MKHLSITSRHARMSDRRRPGTRGFTLIELMTVVAIIGIASTMAIIYLGKDRKAETAKLFAEDLGAQYEMARARAVARQKRQRLVIQPDGFFHYQYKNIGLSTTLPNPDPDDPTSWDYVHHVQMPNATVRVTAVSADLHFDAGVAKTLMTFPVEIDILPDGRARSANSTVFFESGWTVFVTDHPNDNNAVARVMLMAVTGTSTTLPGE